MFNFQCSINVFLQRIIKIFSLTLCLTLLFASACAFALTLEQLRFANYPDKTRLVFDFDENFQYERKTSKEKIELHFKNIKASPVVNNYTDIDSLAVRYVEVARQNKDLKVSIPLLEPTKYRLYKLNSPPRLVIDFNNNFTTYYDYQKVASGLEFFRLRQGSKNGLVHAQVLKVDSKKIELRPALARKRADNNILWALLNFFNPWKEAPSKKRRFYLNKVSNIVRDNHGLAGVNGTFFAADGRPLGILIVDEKILSKPIYDRTSFFLDGNNKPYIDNVFIKRTKNNSNIKVIPYTTSPAKITQLISGGPRLIKKGRLYVSKRTERFQKDIARGRAARTAIGITKTGKVLIVTVDGLKKERNPYDQRKNSIGVSLEELSTLMLKLGAVEAMNLDGGSSSTMVLKNQVVNKPTSNHERLVSNAIILKAKK